MKIVTGYKYNLISNNLKIWGSIQLITPTPRSDRCKRNLSAKSAKSSFSKPRRPPSTSTERSHLITASTNTSKTWREVEQISRRRMTISNFRTRLMREASPLNWCKMGTFRPMSISTTSPRIQHLVRLSHMLPNRMTTSWVRSRSKSSSRLRRVSWNSATALSTPRTTTEVSRSPHVWSNIPLSQSSSRTSTTTRPHPISIRNVSISVWRTRMIRGSPRHTWA